MEEKLLKTGELIYVQTLQGATLAGLLSAKGELCTEKGVENFYIIAVSERSSVQLLETEIDTIKPLGRGDEFFAEKETYFKMLEEKYDARFHNFNGELLEDNELVENAMYHHVWTRLKDEQKEEFVSKINLSVHDLLELFDHMQIREAAYQQMCDEEEERQANKENFLLRLEKFKEVYPPIEAVYQIFNEYMGLKALVK